MKRGARVVLGSGVAAAVVFAMGACAVTARAVSDPTHDELCVEKETMIRADDDKCDGDGGGGRHAFVYVPYTGAAYPVGQKVSHPSASFSRPSTGTFARGGFGGARAGGGG